MFYDTSKQNKKYSNSAYRPFKLEETQTRTLTEQIVHKLQTTEQSMIDMKRNEWSKQRTNDTKIVMSFTNGPIINVTISKAHME